MIDKKNTFLFQYFVDFVQFFTWGKFCLWHLWRFSSLGQNLYNYDKPSAFVLEALVITENLPLRTAILLEWIGP